MAVLRQGARIGVFSPAGPCDPERLRRSLELLRSWGYEPVPSPVSARPQSYLAGDDRQRLAGTVWALSDPELDAAWLTRGGYGITRLLPHLPWEALSPRPVLGFSDATALLYPLWRRGWRQLVHGPVLHSLADRVDRERMRRFLRSGSAPALGGRAVNGSAGASGPLVGGNLCVLNSLTGTPEQFRAPGSLLLLEDVTEQPYRLDRYLTQMLQAGCLEGVQGVALGEFTDCGLEAESVLLELLEPLGIPILTGVDVGHGASNAPFVYGATYRLDEQGLRPLEDEL